MDPFPHYVFRRSRQPFRTSAGPYDFRLMYVWFQKHGVKATRQDIEQQTTVLGHPPRRYAYYVSEMARASAAK